MSNRKDIDLKDENDQVKVEKAMSLIANWLEE